MTMTNLSMEMGVKCAFVPPDEKTAEYLNGRMDATRYQPVLAIRTPSTSAISKSIFRA